MRERLHRSDAWFTYRQPLLPAIVPRENIPMCQAPAGAPTTRFSGGVARVIGLLSRRSLIGPLPVKRDIRRNDDGFSCRLGAVREALKFSCRTISRRHGSITLDAL